MEITEALALTEDELLAMAAAGEPANVRRICSRCTLSIEPGTTHSPVPDSDVFHDCCFVMGGKFQGVSFRGR